MGQLDRAAENQDQLYLLQQPLGSVPRAAPNVGFMTDIVGKPFGTDRVHTLHSRHKVLRFNQYGAKATIFR